MKSLLLAFSIDPALDFMMDNWTLGGFSDPTFYVLRGSLSQQSSLAQTPSVISTLMHSPPKVITSYISLKETKITDRFSNGEKDVNDIQYACSLETN